MSKRYYKTNNNILRGEIDIPKNSIVWVERWAKNSQFWWLYYKDEAFQLTSFEYNEILRKHLKRLHNTELVEAIYG